ncbi:hypothetical protein D3C78_1300350 [compost metagenome]
MRHTAATDGTHGIVFHGQPERLAQGQIVRLLEYARLRTICNTQLIPTQHRVAEAHDVLHEVQIVIGAIHIVNAPLPVLPLNAQVQADAVMGHANLDERAIHRLDLRLTPLVHPMSYTALRHTNTLGQLFLSEP